MSRSTLALSLFLLAACTADADAPADVPNEPMAGTAATQAGSGPAAGSGGSTAPSATAGRSSDVAGATAAGSTGEPDVAGSNADPIAGVGGSSGTGGLAAAGSGGSSSAAGHAAAAGSGSAAGSDGAAGSSPPALKYDCPSGNTDADANGYPDACETMLWKYTAGGDGEAWWTYSGTASQWDPSTLGDIRLTFGGVATLAAGETGAAAGTYDQSKPLAERFSGVHDVRIFDATVEGEAVRLAAAFLTDSTGAHVAITPSIFPGGLNWGTEPYNVPTTLAGKHIVYFKRTITGFGYDATTHMVGLRGGWQAYGY